ncbi:MAG: hypothetical protein KAQ99_08110 [Candidatus Aureabacteria bacterium]|nr:hypothetical protein [Candidatus Auribacterota bacterium]MCK5161520.1 hypothetical protein [Candidatus Auribacterota bacterium]
MEYILWVTVIIFIFGAISKLSKPKQWVNFCGADDEETCEECRKAMEGNPWPTKKAPIPGTLKCGDKCRHALQIAEPPKK